MTMAADIETLYGALQAKRFGKYEGVVVDNVDPQNLGRLKVKVPLVMGNQEVWAKACVPYAGPLAGGAQIGFFALPPLDSHVWVEFEGGNQDYPIWVGCQWIANQTDSAEAVPDVVVLRNGAGFIKMSEESGEIVLEAADGSVLSIGNGSISLEATEINLTANGATVKISASGFDALNGAFTVT
jgi:hypothetical protein